MKTETKHVNKISNQVEFRRIWIEKTILSLRPELLGKGCLDLGAGKRPYAPYILGLGINYTSHDFAKYIPEKLLSGLQDSDWPADGYDKICDILEVTEKNFDLVPLTEVLEHVINPQKVISVAISCLRQNGYLVITVPFNSRMHQAPYWYSSGLSEFFFKDLAEELGYECIEIIQVGDFVDYWVQESRLCLSPFVRIQKIGILIIERIGRFLRTKMDKQLLSSGGLNMLVVLKKNWILSKTRKRENLGSKKITSELSAEIEDSSDLSKAHPHDRSMDL